MSACRVNSAPLHFAATLHLCVVTLSTVRRKAANKNPTEHIQCSSIKPKRGRMVAGLNMS